MVPTTASQARSLVDLSTPISRPPTTVSRFTTTAVSCCFSFFFSLRDNVAPATLASKPSNEKCCCQGYREHQVHGVQLLLRWEDSEDGRGDQHHDPGIGFAAFIADLSNKMIEKRDEQAAGDEYTNIKGSEW